MKINIINGDITKLEVDAIVNAANPYLSHGAGLCGAIYDSILRSGKDNYQNLIDQIDAIPNKSYIKCQYGEVIPFKLNGQKYKYLFQTVGAKASQHDIENQINIIYDCYLNSFLKASELKLHSIAVPMISAGLYGVDKDLVYKCFNAVCKDYVNLAIDVTMVIYEKDDYNELVKDTS